MYLKNFSGYLSRHLYSRIKECLNLKRDFSSPLDLQELEFINHFQIPYQSKEENGTIIYYFNFQELQALQTLSFLCS